MLSIPLNGFQVELVILVFYVVFLAFNSIERIPVVLLPSAARTASGTFQFH